MTDRRTAWDDVQDLTASIGYEAFFEPRTVTPPPVFCEPAKRTDTVDDWRDRLARRLEELGAFDGE